MEKTDIYKKACVALLEQKPESYADLAAKAEAFMGAMWSFANASKFMMDQIEKGLIKPADGLSADDLRNRHKEERDDFLARQGAFLVIARGARAVAASSYAANWRFTLAQIHESGMFGERIINIWKMLNHWNSQLALSENTGAGAEKQSAAKAAAKNQRESMRQWVAHQFPKGLQPGISAFLVEQTKSLMPPLPPRMYYLAAEVLNEPVQDAPPASASQPAGETVH